LTVQYAVEIDYHRHSKSLFGGVIYSLWHWRRLLVVFTVRKLLNLRCLRLRTMHVRYESFVGRKPIKEFIHSVNSRTMSWRNRVYRVA